MTAARPPGRPRASRTDVLARLDRALGVDRARALIQRHPLLVVGVRGYYRDTLGAVGRNDRALYDDAIFVLAPEAFAAFNANTDPGGYRKGKGTGAGKGMASLNPGVWPVYRFDVHRRGTSGAHEALCQRAGPVVVTRDGDPPYENTGMFGINIHRGGRNTTSSEGCQTIPPDQWPAFHALMVDQAKRLFGATWRQETVAYVLMEEGA